MWSRHILGALALLQVIYLAHCYNVTFDHRAIVIDGKREFLISGSIHYPRSTPSMWDPIFKRTKAAGVNLVQIYVHWNYHETVKGQYNFEGNADIVRFIKTAWANGLWVNLRIGPYICAEWNYGGFPIWLREIPGIAFRTYNQPFMNEMQAWTEYITTKLSNEKLFAPQGGPIILAQIENEYGIFEGSYGADGKKYAQWAIQMALNLKIGIPWIMCSQGDIPQAINTCNGFYCDNWIEWHTGAFPNQPAMWTENWPGWFQAWGEARPSRPAQDVAFAYARWVAKGGTHQNYYMWHGGTTFGRWTGGPNIITSYDYDVALDEYGYPQEPKYTHLSKLHAVFIKYAQAILKNDIPKPVSLANTAEAHVYGSGASALTFLSNWGSNDARVTFSGKQYTIPAWSVLIYGGDTLIYNTQSLPAQASHKSWDSENVQLASFSYLYDKVGASPGTDVSSPPEQLGFTKDTTDYMWYSKAVQFNGAQTLKISTLTDYLDVYVDNSHVHSNWGGNNVEVNLPSMSGTHTINILSSTIGIVNIEFQMEKAKAGIRGSVYYGSTDITANWKVQAGLGGENSKLYDPAVAKKTTWMTDVQNTKGKPLTWFYTQFSLPSFDIEASANNGDVYAIDMTGMGKGQIWVNGNHLGRYWMVIGDGNCRCNLTVAYDASACRMGCGEYTQRYYHLPADWMQATDNTLVIQEQQGGDISQIAVVKRSGATLCSSTEERYPKENSDAFVQCAAGTFITQVQFASFGHPTGTCGSYKVGDCNSNTSLDVVKRLCIGRSYCSVPVDTALFGDPCPNSTKDLAIQVVCA